MINAVTPDFENTPACDRRPSYLYTPADDGSPCVSIITPYFNSGPVFLETVRCVQRMSYQHWEWILVDDGSTNQDSLAQLAHVAANDPRITVITQPNRGPSAARNRAVEAARGRYLLQLDADDQVEPTFVEKSLWVMETQRQFAACSAYNVTFGVRPLLWDHGFQEYGRNLTEENFLTSQAMIRRDAYLEAGGYDESIVQGHEDWDFWLNLADAGLWGYTIPEYLTWYRTSHNSRVLQTSGDRNNYEAFHAWLLNKHDRLRTHFPRPEFLSGVEAGHAAIADQSPVYNPVIKPAGTKRLLFLVSWLAPGGADKFNLDLVRMLSQRGYEITIVGTKASANPWLYRFAQITPDIFHLPNFLPYADYPRFLIYLIASRQIDTVLISNSEVGYGLVPYLRAHNPNLPILDYTHAEEEEWKNGGFPWMAVRLGTQLDLNVTSTHHSKEWMVDRGADPGRITVVHTNIDREEWDPSHYDTRVVRERLGIDQDTAVILYMGRVVDHERPLMWMEIMRRLGGTEQKVIGLVVGEGDRLDAMKSFAQQHGLQHQVRFFGALPNHEVRELMAAGDILLLLSENEGLAPVLYEALAMKTVPVATAFGGHSELVTPDCGYLISSSASELEKYVQALHQLITDRSTLAAMASAGREHVRRHFMLDRMADDMVRAISRACEVASARPHIGIDLDLARYIAAIAVENERLNEVADSLRYTLTSQGATQGRTYQRRSAGDVVRQIRAMLLPIGTCRYEMYKRVRRTILSNPHYVGELEYSGQHPSTQGTEGDAQVTHLTGLSYVAPSQRRPLGPAICEANMGAPQTGSTVVLLDSNEDHVSESTLAPHLLSGGDVSSTHDHFNVGDGAGSQ